MKWGNHGGYLIIYTLLMGRHSDEGDTDGQVLCNDITSITVRSTCGIFRNKINAKLPEEL